MEQGYDAKVEGILRRCGIEREKREATEQVKELLDKVGQRVHRARTKLKESMEKPKEEEGESKNRKRCREDMDEEEGRAFDQWLHELKRKRCVVHTYVHQLEMLVLLYCTYCRLDLLDRRAARRHRRDQLSRRRTAASQERMRMISQLAKRLDRKEDQRDDFGRNDEDWDVYKKISKVNFDMHGMKTFPS